jgi:hypothetical protein
MCAKLGKMSVTCVAVNMIVLLNRCTMYIVHVVRGYRVFENRLRKTFIFRENVSSHNSTQISAKILAKTEIVEKMVDNFFHL